MTEPAFAMAQPNFAEIYERALVPFLFRPWAETLLDRAGLAPGDQVLDVACGTGIVGRLALERVGPSGRVVGVDLSPLMIGVARQVAPAVDWREGNAIALPVGEDERFDVAFCHQGLQFFPDRTAAVRELRRVTASGGRALIAVWQPLEASPCFHALHAVAERHLGPVVDQRHAFGDPARLEELLAGAGFDEVEVESVSLPIHFDDAAGLARLNAMAVVGMSPVGKTASDEERQRLAGGIAAESAGVLARFADGGGITFALGANLATAR